MRTVAIYSTMGTKADIRTFIGVCRRQTDEVYSVANGKLLAALCHRLAHSVKYEGKEPIDHLILCGHGGPDWWMSSRKGVTNGKSNKYQITTQQFVDAIEPALYENILISLAACLCSRSPHWYLRRKLGQKIGSDWGTRAYLPGGQASIAARIRDGLWWHGKRSYVRGHRAAGHASYLALLAEHSWPAAEQCKPLFQMCFPEIVPTLQVRRKWVRLVTGPMAERWLMGDDSVIDDILFHW